MVFQLNFSFSFSANLGQPGNDTNLGQITSNSEASTAASLNHPATPSLKRRSPTMPHTPSSRAPPSSTPRTPKRKRCRLDTNRSSARTTLHDQNMTIPETPISKAKDRESLKLPLHSSTRHEAIRDAPSSKAKDRESLEVFLQFSNFQRRASKAGLNPREHETASNLPRANVLATSTLTDPFISIATPVHPQTPGTDLASSLQTSRVKLLASYFEQMDSAAGSVMASSLTSSGSQKASAEVSVVGIVVGSQSGDAEDTALVEPSPSSSYSPETGKQDVGGAVLEREFDGEKAGEEVCAAGVSDFTGPENSVQSVEDVSAEDEKDNHEGAGEDWEDVTMEDADEGRVNGVLSWWKGLRIV